MSRCAALGLRSKPLEDRLLKNSHMAVSQDTDRCRAEGGLRTPRRMTQEHQGSSSREGRPESVYVPRKRKRAWLQPSCSAMRAFQKPSRRSRWRSGGASDRKRVARRAHQLWRAQHWRPYHPQHRPRTAGRDGANVDVSSCSRQGAGGRAGANVDTPCSRPSSTARWRRRLSSTARWRRRLCSSASSRRCPQCHELPRLGRYVRGALLGKAAA